jgi:hypothetical protein
VEIGSRALAAYNGPCIGGNHVTSTVATGMPGGCGSDLTGSTSQKISTGARAVLNEFPLAKPFVPLTDPCVAHDALTPENGVRVLWAGALGLFTGSFHDGQFGDRRDVPYFPEL